MIDSNPDIVWLALGALLIPLASFLVSLFFPERYSWMSPLLTTLLLLTSLVFTFLLVGQIWNEPQIVFQIHWFSVADRDVGFSLYLDNPSALLLVTVSVISFLVHLYSVGYMADEPQVARYFALLGLFTFSMMGLVMAGNLLIIFIFWELVGVSSYLLIGFWHERPKAAVAATKAFLINRIGDIGLLTGILILWANGILDWPSVLMPHESVDESTLTIAGLCIFLGVMGKSAQFPLFTWLPDAMEGPTPVSALIHAATMVAAGVFLIGRLYILFTPHVLQLMAVIGAITALAGAILALIHFDVKRILAYSTISQLGWMVMAMGAGDPAASQLHLLTHAFFKACLFLSAGAALHLLHQASFQKSLAIDIQDIRQLGGLGRKMPFVFFSFALSAASLAGLPFFSGFLSKDSMLSSFTNPAFVFTGLVITFLTMAYTMRMLWFTFLTQPKEVAKLGDTLMREVPLVMRIPLLILAIGSTWLIVSINPFDFHGWWFASLHAAPSFHSGKITILSAVAVLLAAGISYSVLRRRQSPGAKWKTIFTDNFGIDRLIFAVFVNPALAFSKGVAAFDIKWIDGFLHAGVYGNVGLAHLTAWFDRTIVDGMVGLAGWCSKLVGHITRSMVNGKIQSYILWALSGLIIFIVWNLFK